MKEEKISQESEECCQEKSLEQQKKSVDRYLAYLKINTAVLLFFILFDGCMAVKAYVEKGFSLLFYAYLLILLFVTYTYGYIQLVKEKMLFHKNFILHEQKQTIPDCNSR